MRTPLIVRTFTIRTRGDQAYDSIQVCPSTRNAQTPRKQDGSSEAESVLCQTGAVGKFKRQRKAVAPIDDRNLPSNKDMHFQSRMNIMSRMRDGDGLPRSDRCRLHL